MTLIYAGWDEGHLFYLIDPPEHEQYGLTPIEVPDTLLSEFQQAKRTLTDIEHRIWSRAKED